MTIPHHAPTIGWTEEDIPVSRVFDDPYYSLQDGPDETRHVYLAGNGLPDRFGTARGGTPFHIAELGFGTGLNLCVAWRAAREAGVALRYTGFEAHPMGAGDMGRALRAFGARLEPEASELIALWRRGAVFSVPGLTAQMILGDARATLPAWKGRADAWFLDGFAPSRNPDLWSAEILLQVARHTEAGGTAATYTAAGHVRRSLAAAGFDVERRPGFGRKRHMTAAVLR